MPKATQQTQGWHSGQPSAFLSFPSSHFSLRLRVWVTARLSTPYSTTQTLRRRMFSCLPLLQGFPTQEPGLFNRRSITLSHSLTPLSTSSTLTEPCSSPGPVWRLESGVNSLVPAKCTQPRTACALQTPPQLPCLKAPFHSAMFSPSAYLFVHIPYQS